MALYIDRKTLAAFIFSFLMVVVMGVVLYLDTGEFQPGAVRQQHALTVTNCLQKVLQLAVDAETATRGYALTGQDAFLDPYRIAAKDIDREIEGLRGLTRGESDRRAQLNQLAPLLKEKLAIGQRQIELRRVQGEQAAAQGVATGEGKRVMDAIRALVAEMEGAEQREFAAEGQQAESRTRQILAFIVLEGAFAFLLLGFAGIQINRQEKRRQMAEDALRKAHGELEQRVQERTAELESANASLQKESDGHKQAEERALRSEQRFNNLLESAPDAMIAINKAGRIVFTNAMATRLFGYGREELVDQPMAMLMPERFRGKHAGYQRAFFDDPRTRPMGASIELFARRKDGSEFPIDVSLSPIEGEGELLVAGNIRDISDRKDLEERLRESQKMDAIGRLAGGVAHDFNNLLTVINGYSDLLLKDLDARDPMRDRIGQIRNAGKHAAELTQQLLAFSRKQILQPKVLDLNDLVLDVEKMLRRLVREDIDIVTALSPQAELVMVDPGQMTQVLMNLTVNARDAMPGGGRLVIETAHLNLNGNYTKEHPDVQAGSYVRLTVSDSGVGMDDATKSRIFEPFFTTKKGLQGTGLGLATVYGIVKQAGGSIWVYSELGKGTTFKIYLPQVSEEAPIQELKPKVEILRGDETILVVEDQMDLRKLAKEILEGQGYRVLTAADGGQALWQVERHAGPIHLMLTDVVMPGMTARELTDRLQPLRPEMKVLYMSGYTDNVVVHRGIVDLGVAYLQKPFTPEGLAAKVREVLGPVRRPGTILVVDDEAGIRGLLRHYLEAGGYEVLEAEDGKQAMTQAESHRVDLMITDLVMPEQEGIETIRLLRRRQPNLKIIAMSGAMDSVSLDAASHLGTQATLAKPFSNEQLLETVHRLLAQRSANRGVPDIAGD